MPEGTEMMLAARILIVDDNEMNILVLERVLKRAGYTSIETLTDPREAIDTARRYRPDLIMLDLQMPHMDGYEVLRELANQGVMTSDDFLPVLVLTADATSDAKEKSLSTGARDFLTKPFETIEVLLRVSNLLEMRFLYRKVMNQNEELDARVQERTAQLWKSLHALEQAQSDLQSAQQEIIFRLSVAAEFRDNETSQHIRRMSEYSGLIARISGMDEGESELIQRASPMHDVGKIGTPDEVLLKPGPLTPEERAIMEQHSEIGYSILSGSSSELLQKAASIALTHHERIDGNGYPNGLAGDDIPIEGRLAAIADVFDALSTDRVYRKAFPLQKVVDMMKEGRGTQFDAKLLDLFLDELPAALDIRDRLSDKFQTVG